MRAPRPFPFPPRIPFLAGAAALIGLLPASASPQTGTGWDGTRALELMERARGRRGEPRADSGLSNYQARAGGYVYFFLDREDTRERTLVKVDQIALDIFWGEPDRTKQRIIGLRDEKRLPSNIHYHLDHLTVVQDEFGDLIRLGDGDEVRDVLHPAAPGSDTLYEFRLADSLSIYLAGNPQPVRVYELQVRPRRLSAPAFVGSVFLDRASAAIVRMSFTFTPASYVDPRLDYIRISLDNALWDGRYWLPHEQKLEIRRQYPGLDFPAGAVIRGNLRIGEYEFNRELPEGFFRGAPVIAYPEGMRERFPFEEGLYAGLEQEGLDPVPELARLRETAVRLVGQRYISGLPRLRLLAPDASSVLRYGRAEGLFVGAGVGYRAPGGTELSFRGGWPAERERLFTEVGLKHVTDRGWKAQLHLYRDRLYDLGPIPGAAGAINTLYALFGRDWLDPWYADGGTARVSGDVRSRWLLSASATIEEHRSAALVVETPPLAQDRAFRPVRSVAEGRLIGGKLELLRPAPAATSEGWWGAASIEGGTLEGGEGPYLRPMVTAGTRAGRRESSAGLRVTGSVGAALGDPPPQRLFLLGGRATLPGYGYREFAGDRFALAQAETDVEILRSWLRLRATAAVGWTSLDGTATPDDWRVRETEGIRASAGVGVGLIYDILHVDAVRGLNGGDWEWIVSVHPRLSDIL